MTGFRYDFSNDIEFRFSRSSGPGGQNVNKVNTRVEALLHINTCSLLSSTEKELILSKLRSKINLEGYLIVSSQTSRSQIQNRQDASIKLHTLVHAALKKQKKRRPTKPSRSSKLRRLELKKQLSQKKKNRRSLGD